MRVFCQVVLGLSFCLVGGVAASGAATQANPPAKKAAPAKAASAAAFNRALLTPANLKEKAPEVYDVKFTTTKGEFVIRVTRAWAPVGADRFYNLAKNGFFDDASLFRVLPGFVVQFGLSAHPQVSAVWQAASIKDDAVKQSNRRGFVSFAMAGPNTRTTQVFINLGNNARLDSTGFSPIGEVVDGMDVVEKFYSGYGEGAPSGRGPRQDLIASRGKAYLDKDFPQLDTIQKATVVVAAPEAAPNGRYGL